MLGAIIAGVVSAATTVANVLSVAGLAIQGIKTIGGLITSLGKALGLIKQETKVEDLGDKAIQSGLNPEDFDTYAEYVKAVEDFDVDPEKSKKISAEEKTKKGIELAAGVTIEKFKDYPIADFCIELCKNPGVMTEGKMQEIGKLISKSPEAISSILNYVKGVEKDDSKLNDTINLLKGIEKTVNPNITDIDALRNVNALTKQ